MIANLETLAAIVIASLSLLGSTGSVSVLFYRVRQLELREAEQHARLARQQELTEEVRRHLATIATELKWLRAWIDEKHQNPS